MGNREVGRENILDGVEWDGKWEGDWDLKYWGGGVGKV